MLHSQRILGRRLRKALPAFVLTIAATTVIAQSAVADQGPVAVANRNVSDCLNLAKEIADSKARGNAVHQCMRQWIAAVKSQPQPVVVSRAPNQ